MSSRRIYIADCTLRDARHSPGVYISQEDCAEIATHLAELGIDEIEAGLANGDQNEALILRTCAEKKGRAALSSLYFCLRSATIEDSVSFAADNGCDSICISVPSSGSLIELKLKRSLRAAISLMQKAVFCAAAKGLKVVFSGEDAARADNQFLIDYVNAGADAGAARFRFAETVGCLSPALMTERIKAIVASVSLPIEVHCHSTIGLAEANSIAAIEAGAQAVSGTVNGIGERGGNASLATLLLYLYQFHDQKDLKLTRLTAVSQLVAKATGLPLHRLVPIVGKDAFQYELGGQYRAERVYEPLSAYAVGNKRELVFGFKNDATTLAVFLGQAGINLSGQEQQLLHSRLSALVDQRKEALRKDECIMLARQILDLTDTKGERDGINNS